MFLKQLQPLSFLLLHEQHIDIIGYGSMQLVGWSGLDLSVSSYMVGFQHALVIKDPTDKASSLLVLKVLLLDLRVQGAAGKEFGCWS